MKRSAMPGRQVPLRRGDPPARRRPLRRGARLQRRTPARPIPARSGLAIPLGAARVAMAASEAQREKIVGAACVVCRQTKGLTPAHLAPRSLGGCDHPDCVVPLCWTHHRAYDTGRLDLLAHLEPRWRAEIAHAVSHLGLIGAYRRLTGGRLPAADAAYAVDDGSR
jgi:hypothetical protein